jgi:hypothetical protein
MEVETFVKDSLSIASASPNCRRPARGTRRINNHINRTMKKPFQSLWEGKTISDLPISLILSTKVQESVKRNRCGGLPVSGSSCISGAFPPLFSAFFCLNAYTIDAEGLRIALQRA